MLTLNRRPITGCVSAFLAALLGTASLAVPSPAGAVDPGSQLIGCDQADTKLTLTASSHLDPSCTWTRGVEIVASNVVLDCQGAHISTTDRRIGIHVVAPADTELSGVVVRNCQVEGFLNNVRIEREGFRDLVAGAEYDRPFSNILVENSTFRNSRGVGVFVDGYVSGVTLRNLVVEGAGSAGIYLEAGSRDNLVEGNQIHDNGYGENGPNGQPFVFGGVTFWFWGTGREGLAIDGSRNNVVRDNHFSGNSAGGIFLYKNCGEYVNTRPDRWWQRRYGADGNLIEGNTFAGGTTGVWIGSRMGENTLPMDCSDPQYMPGVSLDYAAENVVRNNLFDEVTIGVRVEDDHNTVEDNQFVASSAEKQAVLVGTRFRTPALARPVLGTTVRRNQSTIVGNRNPYRWVHGETDTSFADNSSLGREVGFCEGVAPYPHPFVMTLAVVVYDPLNPPTGGPPAIPPPEPLAPCPTACASAVALQHPSIVVQGHGAPTGDERWRVRGQLLLPHPFAPSLDPIAVGAAVILEDASGARVLDLTVPGGAYDRARRTGWRTSRGGRRWQYVDRGQPPSSEISAVTIDDASDQVAGLVKIRIRGRSSIAVSPTALPLRVRLILDPPTAETGQCGLGDFSLPGASCRIGGRVLRCD